MTFKEWVEKKLKEMAGTGAIVSSCKGDKDFQVFGACSDIKKNQKNKMGKK